eukprot:5944986-Pyramimonas_sp.AAC.1
MLFHLESGVEAPLGSDLEKWQIWRTSLRCTAALRPRTLRALGAPTPAGSDAHLLPAATNHPAGGRRGSALHALR